MDKALAGVGSRPRAGPVRHADARHGNDSGTLIDGLRRPGAWPHAVRRLAVVQTHISWVLLTGELAYKIKKPVDLGFLDFSTLERRRAACEEELRLNRRWAPELYLDVVPITGTPSRPRVGGAGRAIEYAVRMRQFRHTDPLDRRLAAGRLRDADIEDFARALAQAHSAAPVAPAAGPFGTAAAVRAPVQATLASLRGRVAGRDEAALLATAQRWVVAHPGDPLLEQRLRDGFIREVHGDLHLCNLVRWQGRVQAFDCIEFDPALRWIDVLSDVAFLFMDLAYRGRADLAALFLNRYLEVTGDYAGLGVLRYYAVYRALVRANIASIRRAQGGPRARADGASVRGHLALAEAWTRPPPPALVLMHGLSGSGKTQVSDALMTRLPAIRLRSDLERRRTHAFEPAPSACAADRYGDAARTATYERLAGLAACALGAGESVIVDATFLARAEREHFRRLARQLALPCVIVDCAAPRAVLLRRVAARARAGHDASEADAAVLMGQFSAAEPLTAEERAGVVALDASAPIEPEALVREIRRAIARQRPG